MKEFWCVVNKFYDDGKVRTTICSVGGSVKPRDRYFARTNYDEYFDYFDTYEEARRFALQSREA